MLRDTLKRILNHASYSIYKDDENPYDPFVQQRKLFETSQHPLTIFDVGANQGQTLARYKSIFPDSRIYSFEPHPEAYSILEKSSSKFKNVHLFNTALSNQTGKTNFHVNTYSQTSSLLPSEKLSEQIWGRGAFTSAGVIEVNTVTLDDFLSLKKMDLFS